jgi:predicted nucleic acid-binding protein
VKFWDTSAIVPLCVIEPASTTVKSILSKDSSIVVWWGTRTECVSALTRQRREGGLSIQNERQARHVLGLLAGTWSEVQPSDLLRATADRLLVAHPLRAADAFQLAAALHWCQRHTTGEELVTFDIRMREAGRKEGFTILPGKIR